MRFKNKDFKGLRLPLWKLDYFGKPYTVKAARVDKVEKIVPGKTKLHFKATKECPLGLCLTMDSSWAEMSRVWRDSMFVMFESGIVTVIPVSHFGRFAVKQPELDNPKPSTLFEDSNMPLYTDRGGLGLKIKASRITSRVYKNEESISSAMAIVKTASGEIADIREEKLRGRSELVLILTSAGDYGVLTGQELEDFWKPVLDEEEEKTLRAKEQMDAAAVNESGPMSYKAGSLNKSTMELSGDHRQWVSFPANETWQSLLKQERLKLNSSIGKHEAALLNTDFLRELEPADIKDLIDQLSCMHRLLKVLDRRISKLPEGE